MQKRRFGWLAVLGFALVSACTSKPGPSAGSQGQGPSGPGAPARQLNLAVWSNYIAPETLKEFEAAHGIKVTVSNYASNEELLAKLQAGASGFDVAVPSDYMVYAMIQLGLLERLDGAQLKLPKSMDPRFAKRAYDPDGAFSVPYDWGTTGIAVNREVFKGQLKGWKDLFSEPALKGRFSMLDDGREVISSAIKLAGGSLNTRDPKVIEKAKQQILKIRGSIKAFNTDVKATLISGEVVAAQAYSSDALQARRETGGKIEYVVPVEGGTIWLDNLVVPKGAPHAREAYELINFLLDAKTMARTVQAIFVAPANLEVLPLLPEDIRRNAGLFPPPEALDRLEMMQDLGEGMEAFDRAWTEIKAAR